MVFLDLTLNPGYPSQNTNKLYVLSVDNRVDNFSGKAVGSSVRSHPRLFYRNVNAS